MDQRHELLDAERVLLAQPQIGLHLLLLLLFNRYLFILL